MTPTVAAARDRADEARRGARAPAGITPQRAFAVGDPQSSAERFFGALAAHGLLGADGWLARDARLVAMGDYFDYHVPERAAAQVEGVRILAWLAAHSAEQVTILLGNHDTARVMELAAIDDERFELAHQRATAIVQLPREQRAAHTAAFLREFPELATPGYAARDYNAFTSAQRELVRSLLLARRCVLAAVERAHGATALLTHAGVTSTQLAQLGLHDARDPQRVADALNALLETAVAGVETAWRDGRSTPLSLAPLHVAGEGGKEGGGLLYHRPADPDRPGADPAWEREAHAPRRFDPRDLPRGLVQVVGHTGHKKAFEELPRWRDATPGSRGGLRTLVVNEHGEVRYTRGIEPAAANAAVVWMIDPEMHYVPTAEDVALLPLSPSRA